MLNFMCMLMRRHYYSHGSRPVTWMAVGAVMAFNVLLCLLGFIAGYVNIKHPERYSKDFEAQKMKNEDMSTFFHKCEGIILIIAELLWLIPTGAVVVLIEKSLDKCFVAALLIMFVQIAVWLATIFIARIAVKIRFDEDGNRR